MDEAKFREEIVAIMRDYRDIARGMMDEMSTIRSLMQECVNVRDGLQLGWFRTGPWWDNKTLEGKPK